MPARSSFQLAAIAALALAGCRSGSYAYVPEGASVRPDGHSVTRIAIPPEQPRGEVRIESLGITELEAPGAADVDVIHLRMAVSNDSDDLTWTLDTREQLLEIRGEGRSQPIYVNSDRDTLPIIHVDRRDQRILDLFYPLPSTVDDAEDLAGFDLLWQVNTGARPVAQRIAFGRVSTDPVRYAGVYYAGWGPHWWYDPFYTRHVFVHHRPLFIRHPGRVIVSGPSRGHFRVRDHRR